MLVLIVVVVNAPQNESMAHHLARRGRVEVTDALEYSNDVTSTSKRMAVGLVEDFCTKSLKKASLVWGFWVAHRQMQLHDTLL